MTDTRDQVVLGDHTLRCHAAGDSLLAGTVIYLLDGNAALRKIETGSVIVGNSMAVVAIGYRNAEDFDLDRRSRDYTPMPPSGWTGGARRPLDRPHGGATAFLKKLTKEIVPAAETHLGVGPVRRALWGHSYGGLFCLHALLSGIRGFDTIHAASPSLWWGDGMIEAAVAQMRQGYSAVNGLTLYSGDSETSRTGELMSDPRRLRRLGAHIEERLGVRTQTTIFSGASHSAAFDASLRMVLSASKPR